MHLQLLEVFLTRQLLNSLIHTLNLNSGSVEQSGFLPYNSMSAFSHPLPIFLSHSYNHKALIHTFTYSHTLIQSYMLSHILTCSHTHTHIHFAHSHNHTHLHTCSHTHTHTPHTVTQLYTHTHSYTFTRTHTLT